MAPQGPLVPADPVRRRRAFWLLAVLSVLAAVGIYRFGVYVDAAIRSGNLETIDALFQVLRQVALGMGIVLAGLAGWLLWLGRRILRAGQFPLPGQRLIRPTPLRSGPAARRLGWLAVSLGLLLLALAPVMAYLVLRLVQSVASAL